MTVLIKNFAIVSGSSSEAFSQGSIRKYHYEALIFDVRRVVLVVGAWFYILCSAISMLSVEGFLGTTQHKRQ